MTVVAGRKLGQLLAPSSIAIVGASANEARIGNRVIANLDRHGYPGQLFLVNDKYTEVAGRRCVPSLTSIGTVPDLALFAVGADASLDLLTEYAELGGRNAVLLASGFEAGEEGERRRARLAELAEHYGLNVVGPNSQGLWNAGHRMVLAFGSEAVRDDLLAGPVAVIAQSGSLGGAVTRQLLDLGVGVSHFISTGDGAVTDTADYLAELVQDPHVRVVALYLEGTRDARRLLEGLEVAEQRGVRVVVLAGGTSAAGRATTVSHTGRIIARPRLLTQLLEQRGVVVTRTMRELVAATRVLALAPVELPSAAKVAALGISGGMLALMVDACEGRLRLAEFSDATLDRIRGVLPAYTSPRNPVDVTGAVVENEAMLVDTIAAAIADPDVEAVIAGLDNRGYDRLIRHASTFASTARAEGKPLVFALWDAPAERDLAVERDLCGAGVFVADDPAEVVAPLAWLARGSRESGSGAWLAPLPVFDAVAELRTWHGIARLADGLGANVPRTRVVYAEETLGEAELTNPPYVVKPVPNAVTHKSDRGLVRLNLLSHTEIHSAVGAVRAELGAETPVLVQEMVTGVEVLASVSEDLDWGPILTVGSGGTLVELIDDVVHLALPCEESSLRAALARLRIRPLLDGYRDGPAADVDALVRVLLRLQRVLLTHRDTVAEIELNPLVVGANGQGVQLIDVLVREHAR